MIQSIPEITVVCVTTKDYGQSIVALKKTLEHIEPFETLYFSDVPYEDPEGRIRHILIDRFNSVEDYNDFIFKKVVDYVDPKPTHILVVQHDGFVINGSAWSDDFLQYDYIGAPWTYTDGRNVGNGGFSLRSTRLHTVLKNEEFDLTSPEDEKICRYYRQTLQKLYGIVFAPESVAHKFSYEMHAPKCRTFGFHNHFHPPYREPIVLKRTGAMGDLIMLEPVMEWFSQHGYRVILDTQPHYFNLFGQHFFRVEHIMNVNPAELADARVINLDMAYEVTPKQLVLESYYKTCGITDGELRNSRLNFNANKADVKLFEKYVILHTDDTAMAHRNVHGLDWNKIAEYIEDIYGYPVFRVGRGNGTGGQKINTYSENMLAYIVANANYFIGSDSGVAQIAVACGVPSMIFFGSVDPKMRYADTGPIHVMQKACPVQQDHCYHRVISEVGQDCVVDQQRPPCIQWDAFAVKCEIDKFMKP